MLLCSFKESCRGRASQLSLERENKISPWLLNGRAVERPLLLGCLSCWLPQRHSPLGDRVGFLFTWCGRCTQTGYPGRVGDPPVPTEPWGSDCPSFGQLGCVVWSPQAAVVYRIAAEVEWGGWGGVCASRACWAGPDMCLRASLGYCLSWCSSKWASWL